ncbi:MAG: hypothetical protein KDC44_15270 [Phaeodactylibacter sp.]|nr:hypothetical protein [Phaeodactylibacter sp.]
MKRISLAIVALISATVLSLAQVPFSKGTIQIGGTIGVSSASTDITINGLENPGSSTFQLNAAPKVGYFALDYLVAGIGMDYTFNEEKSQTSETDADFLFGPYVQLYLPVGNSKAFFVEGNFGFGNTRDTNDQLGLDNSTRVYAFGVGPGFTVVSGDVNPLGLETSFKYNFGRSTNTTSINGTVSEVLNKTNQWDLSLGIKYYF